MRTVILCLTFLSAPAFAQTATEAAYMETSLGEWSSKAQSADEDYSWVASQKWQMLPDADNGIWIYQENTILGDNPDAEASDNPPPYFQVAIHFRDLGDGVLHTTTHRVSNRMAAREFARGDVSDFDQSWLGEVACMGRIQQIADGFWQGTATCPNGYKGGVKVESRSVMAPDYFVNWDRGFDADGKHIWGPVSGGYIFKRVEKVQ